MDVDGDGVLSMFELEYFYEEQCERMERMGIEPLPFQDLLCQMLDLVKPENLGLITLSDLKRCRMAHIFFDTFFNLEKYLDHEQRDPFDIDSEGPEPSDWDKYASEEYEILVAEETANEHLYKYDGCDIFMYLICIVVPLCGCRLGREGVNYIMCEYLCAQEMAPAHEPESSGGLISPDNHS
uniref:EF-hand domain-containing protein n=1 Tax=Periophthalmus magnuspinnatus TaxID=409849 RepID=A0A3B4AQ64_9GOBI